MLAEIIKDKLCGYFAFMNTIKTAGYFGVLITNVCMEKT